MNFISRRHLSHVLFSLSCAAAPLVAGCVDDAGSTDAVTLDPAHPETHPQAQPIVAPAPAKEQATRAPVHCTTSASTPDDPRCTGTLPSSPPGARNLARTGMKSKGTNSQIGIPQNLQLADIDADGSSDFIQYVSNKIFVSKTDYDKTGILHLYTARPIKRVLVGDFHGDHYSQTCAITDDNMLSCYGISTDKHDLWWWFSQGSFIGDNEDVITGDFDGDGRDDILVYPRAGGTYRMYSIKGSYFFGATPSFAPGNLNAATAGLQHRAGDFNGDGRDDLLIVNGSGQVIDYASVFDGTHNTFWWAFTTGGGFVGAGDQITTARIDDNNTDDIVLHNRNTGTTRFHRMEYAGGSPPAITSVQKGQISTAGNTLLYWGAMHGAASEPGNVTREDAMVYDLGANMFVRSDARWDGTNLTYWWAYSQYAPSNHYGWAAFQAKPYLVLKCKFNDITTEPQTNQWYRDLIYSALVPYWRDISYGSYDLTGTNVVDAWNTMGVGTPQWGTLSRWDRVGNCMNAYSGSKDGYVNTIAIVNGEGDAGNAGGRVLATPSSSNVTFLGHETGHTFGWGHSFDDTDRKNSSWSAPGEYFDYWDIMSAMAVYDFNHPQGGTAGPEMNAPYKAKQGFIPAQRITRLNPGATPQTWRWNLAAINRPEANGNLMVRIGADDNNYYTVEYRMKSGWDQAIPQNTVLVHRVTNGVSYLITAGGAERLVGSTSSFPLGGRYVTVRVNGFAAEGYTADVSIDY
jgi:hypothetical protein